MAPDCDFNTTGLAITTAQAFFVMYCITFVFFLLCVVPFQVQLVTSCGTLHKSHCFNIFTGVFVKIFHIWNIITGLYKVAHQSGHFQAPMLKIKRDKCELNQQPLQSTSPPIEKYMAGIQTRQTLVIDANCPLLTPLMIEKPKWKEAFQMMKQPESTPDRTSEGETPVSQVTLLLGTTPSENSQIQHRNIPDDISDILGTRVYQGYVETPIQTLDSIIVNQPKQFYHLQKRPSILLRKSG